MWDINVLVVDDSDNARHQLIHGLMESGFSTVVGARSGDEAVRLVQTTPERFHVAVIDQVLKDGIDGIETTARICEYAGEIYPIVFTNMPSDDPAAIIHFRNRAFKAGAFRYLYRGDKRNEVKQVTDFVSEINQLRQLGSKVREFYEGEKQAPSLLTQLNVMVTLFDREFKVWYRNPAAERFQQTNSLPCQTCSLTSSMSLKTSACRGCLVSNTFLTGKSTQGIYLHPHASGGKELKYFYIWAQPIHDDGGNHILLEDGKPIAVLQTVQDLSGTDQLRAIPLYERLFIIARSLHDKSNGFDRVRVYRSTPNQEQLELIVPFGYEKRPNATLSIKDYPHSIQFAIDNYRKTEDGTLVIIHGNTDILDPEVYKEKFILWPLMKGERLFGMLSVHRVTPNRPCTESDIDAISEYAREALKAFEEEDGNDNRMPPAIMPLPPVDNLIVTQKTPEGALRLLIDLVCTMTDSEMAHIRYREGDGARLLPISTGEYAKFAPEIINFSDRDYPAIRVMLSGRAEGYNYASQEKTLIKYRISLPIKAREILNGVESFWVQPLIFQGQCIGTLNLYNNAPNHFNEERQRIIAHFAERIAQGAHDYLIKLERNKQHDEMLALEAKKDLAIRAVHNIRTPATALSAYMKVLERDFQPNPAALEIISSMRAQIYRIEDLANDFLRYLKPIQTRLCWADLDSMFQVVINRFGKSKDNLVINLYVDGTKRQIMVDLSGLAWVAEEMLENAVKMKATKIDITLQYSDDTVKILIEDNGRGIPGSIKAKIFEPFQSSDALGTGLGLANARRIIAEHQGHITFDPDISLGALFVIELPVENQPKRSQDAQAQASDH